MTEIQFIHHEEQMEACRAGFLKWWQPLRSDLLKDGISFWTLARMEQHTWELFLASKNLDNQQQNKNHE